MKNQGRERDAWIRIFLEIICGFEKKKMFWPIGSIHQKLVWASFLYLFLSTVTADKTLWVAILIELWITKFTLPFEFRTGFSNSTLSSDVSSSLFSLKEGGYYAITPRESWRKVWVSKNLLILVKKKKQTRTFLMENILFRYLISSLPLDPTWQNFLRFPAFFFFFSVLGHLA